MGEMEEINDKIKESGAKPKRKLGKKGKITVIGVVGIIAILIGAVLYVTFTAPPPEKYWKPDKEFTMPDVNSNHISGSYVLDRMRDDKVHHINDFVEAETTNLSYRLALEVNISKYAADIDGTGELWIQPYLYAERVGNTSYRIKELVFHFSYGDDRNVSYVSMDWRKLGAKNLYFDVTPGKYSGPYGIYDNKLDSDWMNYYRIVGVNKDGKDIKDCGFTFPMRMLFFDGYPNWTNHTITFTATLYYGKYMQGWLGDSWEDVYELSTSVVIYVVPEGGE